MGGSLGLEEKLPEMLGLPCATDAGLLHSFGVSAGKGYWRAVFGFGPQLCLAW